MIDESCETCWFWRRYAACDFGTCKRHAPVIVQGHEPETAWPSADASDWCGEYTQDINKIEELVSKGKG